MSCWWTCGRIVSGRVCGRMNCCWACCRVSCWISGRVCGRTNCCWACCRVSCWIRFVEGRTVAGHVVGRLVGLLVGFVLGGTVVGVAEGWSVGTVGLCVVPLVSVGSAGVPRFVRLRFPGCPGSPINPGRPIGPC